MLAAPDAPAQLVQLGDAEALGVLDQHDGRVGHVDADLDHGRGDEHVGAAGRERSHRLLLLARAHAAVQERQHGSRRARPSCRRSQLGARGARPPSSLRRRPPRSLEPRLDQRADDVGLAAGGELGAQLARRPARARHRRRRGASRSAGARRAARVARSCRGRRSGQARACAGSAWRSCAACAAPASGPAGRAGASSFAPERGALAHAEAVLLVDDGDGERVEADVGLDQRVRADDQRQLSAGELAEDVARAGARASSR